MKIFDKKDIVKIAEDDLKDAKLSSIDFSGDKTKKRAFIDVLAARLAMKLLFSKKIEANNLYSLYTIHNILEEIDIADIYFQGIKIDVRLVFNKEEIFIPKSHFQYDLLPDLYVVLGLEDGLSSAELLGFFEPKELDKNNANKDFYFFEYEKLNKPDKIKNFLDSFVSEENFTISEDDFSAAAELFLPLVDKEISKKDKLFLFNKLAKNITLREQMVEFENFELLSNATVKSELLGDGLLDIVGAQTLFDEEGNEKENLSFVEIETGDDADFEIIEDDINEILPEKEETEDAKKSDGKVLESGLNVVAAGLGLGGAIVAGAAGMAMAENGLAKGSADIAAAGVGLGSEIVGNAVESVSNGITKFGKDTESNGIENLDNDDELELPEFNDDNSLELPEFGDNTEETADIDFEDLKEDNLSELNFAGENDANETIDNEISNIEQLLAQEGTLPESVPDEYFNNDEDDVPEFKPAGDFLMENQDALADLKNPEEDTDEEELSDFDTEDEKDEEDTEEEEKNTSEEPSSNVEETEESPIEELEETAPIDIEEFAPIEKIEEIEPEKFEEPETLAIEELPTIDETFEQPLDDLPEIKDFEEIESVEPTVPKETEEEKVFSLDDFDFEMVDENSEKSEEYITETNSDSNLVSFDSIKTEPNPNYDPDEETFARIREIEENEDEDEKEEESQTYKNENETNGSDDLVSQVDEFLKDIELSDEQRNLLENALADEQETSSVGPAVSEDEPVFEETTDTEDNDMLKVLFKDEKIEEIPEIDFGEKKAPTALTKKKKMIVAASAAGIVLVSLIVGGTAIHHNNMKNSTNLNAPISADANTNNEYPQDSNMNTDTTALNDPTAQQQVQNIPGENQQAGANRDMGKAVSDAFMSEPVNASISKIAWEVPEDLAYNDNFRKYLQTAGKNMKLNLQNDLLLATEMAYSNKIVIDLDISKDGSLASENIVTSSGSKQIDKIVLQSVKETLKYLKMPSSELSGGSAPATLIINF